MQNNLPYDTSFAYAFNWHEPELDLQKALNLLSLRLDEQHDSANCPVSDREYEQIEVILASNPQTPPQMLDHLSLCVECPRILERVAGNPNAMADTLKRLATSSNTDVRYAVADNIVAADLETIQFLVRDGSTDVRFLLAENPNLPDEILEELAMDENPYVAYRAEMTRSRSNAQGQSADIKQMPQQQKEGRTSRSAQAG